MNLDFDIACEQALSLGVLILTVGMIIGHFQPKNMFSPLSAQL